MLRRVREVDLFFRRMRTGEWLGSRFHRSRWLNILLLKPPLLRREPDLDLLDRERDLRLDLDRLLLSRELDLFFRSGEWDPDFFLFGDLDLECLVRALDLELFFREGDDLDAFFTGDLDRDIFLDFEF